MVGEVFIGELSSVVLSFLSGRRGERSRKEGGVDGDSGIKVRAVLLSLFSDFILRDLPSSLLAQLLKLWFVHYSFIIHASFHSLFLSLLLPLPVSDHIYIYKDTHVCCVFLSINSLPWEGRSPFFFFSFLFWWFSRENVEFDFSKLGSHGSSSLYIYSIFLV